MIDLIENLELSLKSNKIDDEILKNLENRKVMILEAIRNKLINCNFLRRFIQNILNICKILNFHKKLKDSDFEFFLFRLKEIICDIYYFFLSFISQTDITNSDIINFICLIVELGSEQKKISNMILLDNYQDRVELILNFLFLKNSEIITMFNLDKKYYEIIFSYFIFILENFCDVDYIYSIYKENCLKNDNFYIKILTVEDVENQVFKHLLRILFYLKSVKFLENSPITKILFFHITKKLFTLLEYYIQKNENPKEFILERMKKQENYLNKYYCDISYKELVDMVLNNQDFYKEDSNKKILVIFYYFVKIQNKNLVDKLFICEIYKMFFDYFIRVDDNITFNPLLPINYYEQCNINDKNNNFDTIYLNETINTEMNNEAIVRDSNNEAKFKCSKSKIEIMQSNHKISSMNNFSLNNIDVEFSPNGTYLFLFYWLKILILLI